MTKQQLQKELLEKVKPGTKPSDIRKLKRSKSADDIPSSSPNQEKQITQLQEQVKFHAETASNYLKSLQSSQAKVSELEGQLKNNPPNVLLTDQLQEKQKQIEELTQTLELTHQNLNSLKENHSTLLDDNLSLKHQGLKDWWQQYEKTQELDEELEKNIEETSNELEKQDKTISQLQRQVTKLQQTNQSLTKDLNLATKLAELRKSPLPNPKNSFWKGALIGCFLGLSFYCLNSSWKPKYER